MGSVRLISGSKGIADITEDWLTIHQVLAGRASVISSDSRRWVVPEGFLVHNLGEGCQVEVYGGKYFGVGIHRSLIAKQGFQSFRFASVLTPHDYKVDLAFAKVAQFPSSTAAIELLSALVDLRQNAEEEFFLAPRDTSPLERSRAMASAREFMLTRLDQPLSVEDVAFAVGLSPCHFSRTFKLWHGISPGAYFLRERIRRACRQLILSDILVNDLASQCGFLSPTSFTSAFRRVTRFSPREFRTRSLRWRSGLEFYR